MLVCGARLNRDRDARLAMLDSFRGELQGTNTFSRLKDHRTRPGTNNWVRARGVEEEALRVLLDVLEAVCEKNDSVFACHSCCEKNNTDNAYALPSRQATDGQTLLPRIPRARGGSSSR